MASEFYQITGGDEALLVGPGQAHCRKLGIASAALNMRVGFMLSFCKTDDKNNALAAAQSDSISLASPYLGLLVGLRSYGTSLVNTTGQYFYGIGTATNTVSGASSNAFSSNLGFVLYKNVIEQEVEQIGVAENSRFWNKVQRGITVINWGGKDDGED